MGQRADREDGGWLRVEWKVYGKWVCFLSMGQEKKGLFMVNRVEFLP